MLILFETAAGYGLFKVVNDEKVKLQAFKRFEDTNEAVAAATALVESKLDSSLKKFLKKQIVKKDLLDQQLVVQDSKLGGVIRESLDITCIGMNDEGGAVAKIVREIRGNLSSLIPAFSSSSNEDEEDIDQITKLGLAHTLSRYKLKFSPDKVDTMIVQAINLLDEIDKEINTYAMRVKEWYGWHFPEMQKIVLDNLHYAKIVMRSRMRSNMRNLDFSDILGDEAIENQLKETAEISMGTDISEEDIENINELCEQVVSMTEYRAQLYDYLRNRMNAIAPNLTVLVGELVGARLIAHSGSLMNLAKAPASTVQILGAEKALFRAIKTKHNTPKHGLIFGCSLVGQSSSKNKGKISRVLAAKASLAIRVDALGDEEGVTIGMECREKVEARLRQLETGEPYRLNANNNNNNNNISSISSSSNNNKKSSKKAKQYNDTDDTISSSKKKKRSAPKDDDEDEEENLIEPVQKKKKN